MSYLLVYTTASSQKEADRIASKLVESRLAACVNVVPSVTSHYRWKGKQEKNQECLLLIKTKAELFVRVEETIRKIHSYEVPEVIAVPVEAGSRPYLEWLEKETV